MRTGISSVRGCYRSESLNTFVRGLAKKRFRMFQHLGVIERVIIKLDRKEGGLENVEWIRLAGTNGGLL